MRLSFKMMLAFLAIALVLTAVVASDVVDKASVCGDADHALAHDELTRADTAYDAALADDPKSDCALAGKERIAERQCAEAMDEEFSDLRDDAHKAYATLLARQPAGEDSVPHRCALQGLQRTAKNADKSGDDPPKPTETTPPPTVVPSVTVGVKAVSVTKVILCDVHRDRKCRMVG